MRWENDMNLTLDWEDKSESERVDYIKGHTAELIRLAKFMNLKDLSERLGVSMTAIYGILKGVYNGVQN